MVHFSSLLAASLVATASVRAAPLNKRVAQTIAESTQPWVAACQAAGGAQKCGEISQQAFSTLLAAPGPCEQQNAADAMIDLAKELNNDSEMIRLAQIFRQQPRNAPDNLSVLYCQEAPKNAELNGLFQCQFEAVNPTTFTGNVAVGQPGTIPFGLNAPLDPAGSCPANTAGPIADGVQLHTLTQDPGAGGAVPEQVAEEPPAVEDEEVPPADVEAPPVSEDAPPADLKAPPVDEDLVEDPALDADPEADKQELLDHIELIKQELAEKEAQLAELEAGGAEEEVIDEVVEDIAREEMELVEEELAAEEPLDEAPAEEVVEDVVEEQPEELLEDPAVKPTPAKGDKAEASSTEDVNTVTTTISRIAAPTRTAASSAEVVTATTISRIAAPTVTAAPVVAANAKPFTLDNGKAAQAQNAQFAGLNADSTCTDGEQACVDGGFAQCVGGKFAITACSGGTQCFALPLVNAPGTSITCSTEADAIARIAATGAQGGISGA